MRNVWRFLLMSIACVLPLLSPAHIVVAAARFVDNGDGTITDTERKIMWQKGDNGKEVTFEEAQRYCNNLRLDSHADWRLPEPEERDTAVVIQLMMPKHSRVPMPILISIGHPSPRSCSHSTITPQGGSVSRAYPAREGARAFVRAVRSLGINS